MPTNPAETSELDLEGNPIGPMTAAEFKVVREYLGLTTRWLSEQFNVDERSVQRWEGGQRVIPEAVREAMEALEAHAGEMVGRLVAVLNDMAEPAVLTYRTDREFHQHFPEETRPAAWHRAVVARAVQEVPGVSIDYWSSDAAG
ncbi:helix-turn-helix domain-containing protein [Nocardia thailandica]|uniref:helix-turn-helix domain-containing protein n=1 Tax=Nocardia thailandica TaxID=257275 RepID=UPI0002FD91DC|nr:DUF1870 family protein [Nocardia thailandica]